MSRKRLNLVLFDAMGTVLSLKPWVVAMMNEFTRLSKKYGVKFEDISAAWNTEWRKANKEIRRNRTKSFRSVRALFSGTLAVVGKRVGVRFSNMDIETSIKTVYNYVNNHSETFPDVPGTLQTLKEEGYKIGIVSDADADDLMSQLRSAGILGYFDLVTTSSEVRSYKPNSRIFEVALQKVRCKSSRACYIGDTPEFDIAGANRMGLRSVLVTHGKAKEIPKRAKPSHVIKEVGELVQLLMGLSAAEK